MAMRGLSNGSLMFSEISNSSRVYTKRKGNMRNFKPHLVRVHVIVALTALLLPSYAADAKADKKKSQAAYQQGVLADKAGQRTEAIADYSAAVEADPSNGDALRARANDYLAAGDRAKALEDFEKAINVQPSAGDN